MPVEGGGSALSLLAQDGSAGLGDPRAPAQPVGRGQRTRRLLRAQPTPQDVVPEPEFAESFLFCVELLLCTRLHARTGTEIE